MPVELKLISVDCGLRECGVAVWCQGELDYAGLVRGESLASGPEAWWRMARAVEAYAGHGPTAIETQQHRHTDTPAKTRAILELNGVAGAVALACHAGVGKVVGYLPSAWKGSIDGDAMIERVKGRLSAEEMARVELPPQKSLQHNVWDSCGIGLYYFGRLEKRRVIAR